MKKGRLFLHADTSVCRPSAQGKPPPAGPEKMWKHRAFYLLLLPAVAYVILFCYTPMYGLQIHLKDYKGALGIAGRRDGG